MTVGKKEHIAFSLLLLIIGIFAERVVPHVHVKKQGRVMPTMSRESSQSHQDEEEHEEELHSSFYRLSTFDIAIKSHYALEYCIDVSKKAFFEIKIYRYEYNILPKIVNGILYIVHLYASKAPPLYTKHIAFKK